MSLLEEYTHHPVSLENPQLVTYFVKSEQLLPYQDSKETFSVESASLSNGTLNPLQRFESYLADSNNALQ